MPSDDLQRFLLLCQEKSRTSLDKCAVCMGNEAGDLDSLASALAYAYLGSLLDPSTTVIPLFQQGRHDFALRPENCYALQEAGLAPDLVLTLDDLPADTLRDSSCRYALIDHNKIQKPYKDDHQQTNRVTAVIDHHQDEQDHLDAKPRIVTLDAGSCASLVTNYFADEIGDHKLVRMLPRSLAVLLLGAILIDTGNLKPHPQGKATDQDRRAAAILSSVQQLSSPSLSTTSSDSDYFARLREAKSDVSSLSLRDHFRRDYKSFTSSNGFTVGLSSVLVGIEGLAAKQGWEALQEALAKWAQERDLDLAVVLTNFRKGDKTCKEVLCLPLRESLRSCVNELPGKTDFGVPDLALQAWHSPEQSKSPQLSSFQQGNVKATRKQVLPALRGLVESLGART